MPLNMTKIGYGHDNLRTLQHNLTREFEASGKVFLTTRYRPKRYTEMVGGSLYWIIAHQIVGRSEILAFEDADDGRTRIVIHPDIVLVKSRPKRAHQGWRYLEEADAPIDLGDGGDGLTELPSKMLSDLTRLALI